MGRDERPCLRKADMHTTVIHPVTGAEWACPTKALDHFLSIGWQLPAEREEDTPEKHAPHDAAQSPSPKSRSNSK